MNEVGAEELKRANEDIARATTASGRTASATTSAGAGSSGASSSTCAASTACGGWSSTPRATPRAGTWRSLIPEEERFEPSRPGRNLVLSLDWRLQELAEETFPGIAGAVVALDAKTGFLLALVDRPSPDPNKLSGRISRDELRAIHDDPLRPELFRAIQEHFHPGSTFKVVTSVAALEEKLLKPGRDGLLSGPLHAGWTPLALRQGARPRDGGPRPRPGRLLRRLLLHAG